MLFEIVQYFHSLPPSSMLIIEFLTSVGLLMLLFRCFGLYGLYAYIITLLFVANIQVLKIVQFDFYPDPIALGKISICSIFLAMDMVVEFYGKSNARRAIWLGFASNLTFTTLMIVTIGYQGIVSDAPQYSRFLLNSDAIETLFLPLPAILFASLISYLICQNLDINIFQKIKQVTQGRYLWLRSFGSTTISSLLDNIIFYSLALYILSPYPVDLRVLLFTYILGTFLFRFSIVAINSNMMYIAKWIASNQNKKSEISASEMADEELTTAWR